LLFEKFLQLGFGCAERGEEILNVFKMTVSVASRMEREASGLAKELGQERGYSLLGAARLSALPLADSDHDVADFGDLEEGLDYRALVTGVAPVL